MKILSLIVCLFFQINYAFAEKIMYWEDRPLVVNLKINEETLVELPSSVAVFHEEGILNENNISIINNNGFLYLKPTQIFEKTRLIVKSNENKTIMFIDLDFSEKKPDKKYKIKSKKTNVKINKNRAHIFLMKKTIKNFMNKKNKSIFEKTDKFIYLKEGLKLQYLFSSYKDKLKISIYKIINESDSIIYLNPSIIKPPWLSLSFFPNDTLLPHSDELGRSYAFIIQDNINKDLA